MSTKPHSLNRCSQCHVKSCEIESLKSLLSSKTSKIYQLERQLALLLKEKDITTHDHNDNVQSHSEKSNVNNLISPSTLLSYTNACCGTSDDILSTESSSKCCGTDDYNEVVDVNGDNGRVIPFETYNPGVFSSLSIDELEASTTYSYCRKFNSRSVAYYGDIPYSYPGGEHQANSISSNLYLEKVVIPAVTDMYPWFRFNSIMVTRYINGSQNIPFHSDDEESIELQSSIMTISLGITRNLIFRPKAADTRMSESTVPLGHGDVLLMSRLSQDVYEHSVPKDFSKNTRISITFRYLIERNNFGSGVTNTVTNTEPSNICHQELNPGPLPNDPKNSSSTSQAKSGQTKAPSTKSTTLFISSSMFSHLDSKKLSSKSQDAFVFSYPGATAKNMHHRFRTDSRLKDINPQSVDKIFLLCGTNDVDNIINSPKHLRKKIIYQSEKCNMEAFDNTCNDIEGFVHYLVEWAGSAEIRILKVLPRESKVRNNVINKINCYTSGLVDKFKRVKPCEIVKDRFLFANEYGFRKSYFFMNDGDDNVHLNKNGTARLANHLKFTAHNC